MPGPDTEITRRPVRSYVLRSGRITTAQQRALTELLPRYGIAFAPAPCDLDRAFGRRAPRILEIGFGNGDSLAAMAQARPDEDFIGVEVHEPGIGHCLLLLESAGVSNVRIIRHDAVEVLRTMIPDGALAGINLFFPDPWPKKRHHKRRIVQPEFVRMVAAKLAPGGIFHAATDWPEYAAHMAGILAGEAGLEATGDIVQRVKTRFERRGERLGHPVAEFNFRRVPVPGGAGSI